jgi:uncharacterized protein with PIN domain
MLGRLARWLRLLGYDAALLERPPARVGPDEVLLTRRTSLAKKPGVVFVDHDRLGDQLGQVVKELGLEVDASRFFSRCLDCNLLVEPVERSQVQGLVPDYIFHTAERFTRCPQCGKIFWPGSHGRRAIQRITSMLGLKN